MELRSIDKRGQQLTTTTLILIILGIAVFVLLIFGFTTGWGNLSDKLNQYAGGSSNVDTVRGACAIACSTGGETAFCTEERIVNFGKNLPVGEDGEDVSSKKVSCNTLADLPVYDEFKVEDCSSLCK
jgi:hypothetical protein